MHTLYLQWVVHGYLKTGNQVFLLLFLLMPYFVSRHITCRIDNINQFPVQLYYNQYLVVTVLNYLPVKKVMRIHYGTCLLSGLRF